MNKKIKLSIYEYWNKIDDINKEINHQLEIKNKMLSKRNKLYDDIKSLYKNLIPVKGNFYKIINNEKVFADLNTISGSPVLIPEQIKGNSIICDIPGQFLLLVKGKSDERILGEPENCYYCKDCDYHYHSNDRFYHASEIIYGNLYTLDYKKIIPLDMANKPYVQRDEWVEVRIQYLDLENPIAEIPSPETKIYIMIDRNTGYYKIGKSHNPKFREKTLQSEKPTIELLNHFDGFVSDERKLHKKFENKRIRGEWFNLNESDILEIGNYFTNKSGQVVSLKADRPSVQG